MSYGIRIEQLNLIRLHYPTVDLRIIFTYVKTVATILKSETKSIIHRLTCSSFNGAYNEKTSRESFQFSR